MEDWWRDTSACTPGPCSSTPDNQQPLPSRAPELTGMRDSEALGQTYCCSSNNSWQQPQHHRYTSHGQRGLLRHSACFLLLYLLLGSPAHAYRSRETRARMGPRSGGPSSLVEFSRAGIYLPLEKALQLDLPVQPAETSTYVGNATSPSSQTGAAALPAQAPQAGLEEMESVDGIRLLIAVTSACCNKVAMNRRRVVRQTWARRAVEMHPNVEIKFFLGQPGPDRMPGIVKQLQEEIRAHKDIVMIRGRDEYKELPNKTRQVMRYALSHPGPITHVLKTDDDTYVRVHMVLASLKDTKGSPRLSKMYMGCIEINSGFQPIRDKASKWYTSYEELPDEVVPWGVQYAAGWGYVLSRDVLEYLVHKIDEYDAVPEKAPGWYKPLHWEDVMVGALLKDFVNGPEGHWGFKAAWWACTSETVLKHMDVDAPKLMKGLYEQDVSGLWAAKPVQCSLGDFTPNDHGSWYRWRSTLPDVEAVRRR